MLPDIDQQSWDQYQQQNLGDEIKKKIDSFGLQNMIGEKIAGLQGLVTPPPAPPPEPPPPPPAAPVEPPEVTQARQRYAQQPEPPPQANAFTPPPSRFSPAPAPSPVASPSPPPTSSDDWFGQALGRVHQAGGDVQKFADNFSSGAGDAFGGALNAAAAAGANVQQFAQGLSAPPAPAPPPQATAGLLTPGGVRPPGASVTGVPGWLTDLIAQNAPADLANDPDFIRTVAAGAKAESGWDPNRIQQGYSLGSGAGARGLFQFDMGGMGAGQDEQALLGQQGAEYQASKIVPLYAQAYRNAPAGLTPDQRASWVAGQAERPLGYTDPTSAARRNYASAYGEIGDAIGGAFSNLGTAAQGAIQQVSQFGDKQLSADEAYAACGPAAAVRFASMYGRNPSLREATDLAASVGWTPDQGMAGLASEKSLMDKLGIATRMIGANIQQMAAEAQTGNPVTISTPGHYFTADGYDPASGAFHVGQSGLDLKGGSEWMTVAQMQARMGQIQGALLADNPNVPQPSTADQTSNPLSYLGRLKDSVVSRFMPADQQTASVESKPLVNPLTGQLTAAWDEQTSNLDRAIRSSVQARAEDWGGIAQNVGRLNEQIMQTEPGAPAAAALGGVQGRLGEVLPKSYEDFTSRIQSPDSREMSGVGQALGTGLSALGTGSRLVQDVLNEVSPATAGARVHAGEDVLMWQDPVASQLLQNAGITRDMAPGDQALAMLSLPPDQRNLLNQRMIDIRSRGAAAASEAAWQPGSRRAELEGAYNLLAGGAAMGLAPEGLASGLPRLAASLAVDPSGAPFAALQGIPEAAKLLGRLPRAPQAGEALGIVSRTGADVREGLYGAGEAGTYLPRTELPNASTWENALAEGARYSDAEGEGGYWAPPLNQARLTPETAGLKGEDRIRQVIADLQFNHRFPQDLTDPDANQFARELQALGRGMGSGDWTPEQTALAALLTRYSQGRSQVPVKKLFGGLGEEWAMRQQPSLQTQGAVSGGKAAAYGMVVRPEVLAAHIGGDTTNPTMMQLLTALGRPAMEELPVGSPSHLASYATRAERNAVIDRGVQAFYDAASAAGQGGTRGDDVLIKGENILRKVRDEAGNVIGEKLSLGPRALKGSEETWPAKGRQEWADTIPALHQKFLDWGQEAGDYAGLSAVEKKDKLLQDIQNAGVAGIGIDKSTFVPNMGFNPDYATLDLRMRRQGFGLSPKATLTRAERNLLEQKIVQNFPEAESPYVAQWLPWAYMTDEKTDYRSIPGAYNAVGDLMKRAQQVAQDTGRPIGEVVGQLAEQTPRVALQFPDPTEVITRIGMSPAAIKRMAPGTSGEAINKAFPELKNFADQAGVEIVGKPSVGTGMGIDPLGKQVIEPDADLVVRGPMSANRWFGAAWAKANPNEDSIMLAHTGPGLQNAADSLGTVILGKGSQDAALLQQALTDFSPYGWHTKVRVGAQGDPEATHLVIGGLETDAATFKPRLDEFTKVLRDHGFSVESSAVEPAHIEFIGDKNRQADQILYGGPRGATRVAEGGAGQVAGQVGEGGPGVGRSIPQVGQTLASLTGQGANAPDLGNAAAFIGHAGSPLRNDLVRQAIGGGIGGGYAASQQEGATPQDILRGAALGALGGGLRGALPGARTNRLLSMVARETNAFDENGRLVGRPTEVDRKLWTPASDRAPSSLNELVSPAGNLLSTVAGGRLKPAWNDITGISRTLAGSEPWTINPPSPEAIRAMPNLMHMAGDMPEVRATLQRVAEDNPDLINKYTQGVITHDQLVKDTANKLGMTRDDFMKSKVGQAFNPQELLALRGAIADTHDEIAQMTREIKAKGGAKELNTEERVGAVRKMLEAAQLQAIGRGAVATAGRALNQQKINVDRGIASMLTRGNELRSASQALTRAKARQAYANAMLGKELPETAARPSTRLTEAERASIREAGAPQRAQNKQAGALYDQWIKLYEDELKAQNAYDQKTWDAEFARLNKEAERRGWNMFNPKDATAEGQKAWAAAEAKNAEKAAALEERRHVAAWNRKMAEADTQRNIAGKILERLGGENVTNDMIDHLVKIMDSDNPMDAAKYLQSLQKVSWWDRMSTMRYASMLSSAVTHTAQATSNTGQLVGALVSHPVAVGFDVAAQKLGGGERQRYMGELPAMLRGIVGQNPSELADSPYMVRGAAGGIRQGAQDAMEIMRSGLNPGEVSRNWEDVTRPGFGFEQTGLGQRMGARASGAVNAIAEGPLRALSAGDSLIRGAARGAFAHGLAERQAIREGYTGAERTARAQEILKNFDEFPELFAQADDAAKRVVLQESRGEIQGVTSMKGPMGAARSMVMPFVRTPWNVAAQGAGLTPLGYAGALRAAAQGDRGEAVDRAARATLGTGILGAATALGANGYLTGGTPTDPSEKSSLEPNWQPYSLRIPNDDGSARFIKFSNLGPVGVPLAAGAILGDAAKLAQKRGEQGLPIDPGSLAYRMAGGMGRYMLDQTMLQGLAAAIDAVQDPERKSQNFFEGMVTQFAPYAAAGRQLDRVLGTGPRDTREGFQGLLDAVMATYPGLSGNVPQKLDPLGRPVEETQTGLNALLSPMRNTLSPYDPLTKAMREADVGVGATPKSWRNFAMTEDERRQYQQQSGYYIDQMMQEVLADPTFQNASLPERQAILRRLIANARNAGGADIMGRLGESDLMQRYIQEQQRTAPVPR